MTQKEKQSPPAKAVDPAKPVDTETGSKGANTTNRLKERDKLADEIQTRQPPK